MADPRPFPLPISYGHTDAVRNSGGFLINWEAEVAPRDARTPVTLRGTPGLKTFADTGQFPVVAMLEVNEAGYVITKVGIYRIFPDGGHYQLGSFVLGQYANAATNGTDIVATDGLRIWSYTIRSDEQSRYDNDTPYTDFAIELTGEPNWYPTSTIAFLDGYLIASRDGTNQFYNTDGYSLTVNALAFSSAETNPDLVRAVFVDHQILTVFGSKTTEFWYDAGVGESPFQRVQGGVSEHGVASPFCIAKINNNTFMVTPEATVYAFQGYQPRPISTPAIEDELKKRDLTQATGFCYTDGGHFYYQLTAGDFTAVYDMSTGLWHVRRDYNLGRHRASCHMFAFNKNLVGDFSSGKIYHMSTEYYDEDGDPLIAQIITGPLETGGRAVGIGLVEWQMDVGLGNADCPDPQAGMEISRDDGKTFGNQRLRPIGKVGKYLNRVRFQRNGDAVTPRFRFVVSDPVRRSMTSQAWISAQ